MFDECLKAEQKNNAVKNASVKYALKKHFNDNYNFNSNIKKVADMPPVADLKGNEFAKGNTDLVTQVTNYFNSIGNKADSKYGTVILNRTGVKSSVSHGIGRTKAIAFKAVPDIIKNGEIIDYQQNYKKRGYDSAVFSAPITIDNQQFFVAVVVRVETDSNSYYLHEIAVNKKEDATPFKTGTDKVGTPSGETSSIYNLLNKLQNVNSNSEFNQNVKFSLKEPESKLAENGVAYREYESGNEQSRVDTLNSFDDVKFSRKESVDVDEFSKENDDYSYDTLITKPDMPFTNITDGINYTSRGITRKDIINEAVNNAKKVGRENENGNAVIYVYDIAKEIIVPKKAIQHSLDRRIEVNGPVVTNIGNILKNSIRINELIPRSDNIEKSYVLIGVAKSQQNEPYIVSFVVNEFTNEVKLIDVLYSVNAKTEPAGSLSPQLSTAATDSKISISDLLDYVNRYYPDILPEDVLRHYGYSVRPDGVIGESALYSRKESVDVDEFGEEDYNYPKLGKAEYKKLYSEIMSWYADRTNQIVEHRLDNDYKYVCELDDDYNLIVLGKCKSINIHERRSFVDEHRKNRKRNVNGVSRYDNGRSIDGQLAGNSMFSSENGETPKNNDKFIGKKISAKGRGNRAGYAENGNNDNLQEKKRYSVKEEPIDYNTILQENDELAQMNEDLKHMLKITFIWIFKLLNLCTIYS